MQHATSYSITAMSTTTVIGHLRTAIVIQLVDVTITRRRDELIAKIIAYARSEHASDMLMTRAGHILLWRSDSAIESERAADLSTDMTNLRDLLQLDTDPVQLVMFDDKPELFIAYWYGGLSSSSSLEEATENNIDECDDYDYDYDYDLSVWFRKGSRITDNDVVMELRRRANVPNTAPAKDTMIWSTPTSSVWRPINVPPTRRLQISCAYTAVVMLTVPEGMTVHTQRMNDFIFVNVSK